MTIEIKVPMLPESVADATILDWNKKVGEQVKQDDILVELETDKVVLEIPAPKDGILQEIKKTSGTVVNADEILAIFEIKAITDDPKIDTLIEKKDTKVIKQENEKQTDSLNTDSIIKTQEKKDYLQQAILKQERLSPSKRRLLQDNPQLQNELTNFTNNRSEQRIPMSRLRQKVANRLLMVKQSTAMLTTFNEVDMSAIMQLRNEFKESFAKKHGVKLGFMSFFVKAAVAALQNFPAINASIDNTDLIYHNYFDIGIAVSSERGLVVPVLRDVNRSSMAEIESQIKDFAIKARNSKLKIDDLIGGNFTITNGGIFGSMLSTPILNPPQSAILGMHNIVERPVVINKEIVIRPIMYLALSYDHRIVDGKDSVSFLVNIKQLLENPNRLVLDV